MRYVSRYVLGGSDAGIPGTDGKQRRTGLSLNSFDYYLSPVIISTHTHTHILTFHLGSRGCIACLFPLIGSVLTVSFSGPPQKDPPLPSRFVILIKPNRPSSLPSLPPPSSPLSSLPTHSPISPKMVSEAAAAAQPPAPQEQATEAPAPVPTPAPGTTTDPAAAPMTEAEIRTHVEQVIATQVERSPIYGFLLGQARVHAAARGRVRIRLGLEACHLNARGGLHGSVSATIVDWAGGLAVAAWDGRARSGVSVDLHARYLASAGLGDLVEVQAVADRVGAALAYTSVTIRRVDLPEAEREEDVGPVLVSGTHTKYVRKP